MVKHGLNVYFGEVLGKHSEVCGPIESHEIKMISDNPEVVKIIEDFGLQSGYNPLDYTFAHWNHEGLSEELCTDDLTVGEAIDILLK
jgi:hypothetical protein